MTFASTKGRLLVAAPPLEDPNFDRTVLFMVEHNSDGALGIVLNRPTDEIGIDGLEAWTEVASPPVAVFSGGPVEPNALIGLAAVAGTPGEGFARVEGDLGTVDLALEPGEIAPVIDRFRVFRGYAGWSPGQLEGELGVGAWIVVASEPGDLFTATPDRLWRTVLGRQAGTLSWLANFPDDLSAN
jgi:putative transcriptional regulator